MGSVTGVFTSENRLHPAARAILSEAIDKGWADPAKVHRPSRELANLLGEAKAIFARILGLREDSISFLGEPTLGFYLGVQGLLPSVSDRRLIYPMTSRQEIIAVSQASPSSLALAVDLDGRWEIPNSLPGDLLLWPSANGETGAQSPSPENFEGAIFVDATSDPMIELPKRWSAALFDSRSWSGPAGLGIFAVNDHSEWRNPLPHLDHRVVPGGYNPALAIASAVALEADLLDRKNTLAKITALNTMIRNFLQNEMSDVDIASPSDALPHLLSFSLLYIDAEQLVDRMERRGLSIDSGSACISANLEASHVLAAMGRLTHGNVRIHLYPDHTESDVTSLLQALKEEVTALRGEN
jgi:cysteine desulfurase